MRWLVAFRRSRSELLRLEEYKDAAGLETDFAHLESEYASELDDVEVVVLEAPNLKALHRSHGRYFRSIGELVEGAVDVDGLRGDRGPLNSTEQ